MIFLVLIYGIHSHGCRMGGYRFECAHISNSIQGQQYYLVYTSSMENWQSTSMLQSLKFADTFKDEGSRNETSKEIIITVIEIIIVFTSLSF